MARNTSCTGIWLNFEPPASFTPDEHPLIFIIWRLFQTAMTSLYSLHYLKRACVICFRIRQEKNGGAWCPKAQISSEIREYLEVDLQKNHLVTWTETQGRFGNGQGQEYAEAFLVEYWRPSINQWVVYKDSRGEKVRTSKIHKYNAP